MITAAPAGLVRCPFCASTHVAMGQHALRVQKLVKFYVTCDVCWAKGPACFDRTEAHAAWNERAYGVADESEVLSSAEVAEALKL